MQKAQVYIDSAGKIATSTTGVLLTADKIAEMAKGNLLEAISLMSRLQMEGNISTATMQKMFTGRHFTEAQAVLRAVGGDWKKFNEVFAQGVNYQQDYAKQMMNVNNELAKLKNNMLALGQSKGYLNTLVSGTAIGINNILEDNEGASKTIFEVLSNVVGLGLQFGVLAKGLSLVVAGIGALTAPIALVAGAITGGIYAWQRYSVSTREAQIITQSMLDVMSNSERVITKFAYTSDVATSSLEELKRMSAEIKEGGFVSDVMTQSSYSIAGLLGKTDKLGESLLSLKKIFEDLGTGINIEAHKTVIDKLTNQGKEAETSYKNEMAGLSGRLLSTAVDLKGDLYKDELKSVIDEAVKNIGKDVTVKIDGKQIELKLDTVENLNKYLNALAKPIIPEHEGTLDFSKITRNEEGTVENATKYYDKMKEITDNLEKEKESMGKTIDALNKSRDDALGVIKNNRVEIAKERLEIYKEYGKIFVDGKELFGEQAFEFITKDSFGDEKEALDNFSQSLKEFKSIHGDGFDFSAKGAMEYAIEVMGYLENRRQITAEIALLEQQILIAQQTGTTGSDIGLLSDRLAVLTKLRAQTDEFIENAKTQKRYEIDLANAKKNTNEYTFKYKNFLKESLDLELERLKIGKTSGQQAVLEYEYKLKQLEVNKEIAEEELKSAKAMSLKNLGGLSNLNATRENLRKLQAERDLLTASTFQTGESGKANKDKLTQLDAVMSAMVKVLEIEEKITLAPLQEFNKISDAFPKTLDTIVSALNDSRLPNMNIWKSMLTLRDEDLQESIDKVSEIFNKQITSDNIDMSIQEQVNKVLQAKRKTKDAQGQKAIEEATLEYVKQVELLNDMNDLKKDMLNKDKKMLEYYQQMNKPYEQTGNFFSTLGSIFKDDNLGQLGDMFTQFADLNSSFQAGDLGKVDFGSMFKDGKFDTQGFGKLMESAEAFMSLGQLGGSFMGGLFGNGQAGGELGSIGGMIGGMFGPMGAVAGSMLGGALGGLFGGDSEKDQAKAQKKTEEANRLYQENTNALNKLANNMANLNSGIDSLNSSLLSSFSQIPTFDKLNSVTDALKEMNKTLISSRDFGSVAYQITKSKKSGGGLFSKSQTVQWTETHEKTLQDMLNQYGFKGSIYDMDSKQLQNFADWLEDVKLGEQSNVEGMAQLIQDYADAMNKMEDNINDFFYDATMEGFSGISSLAQEELKLQLTDFYKNLGITIDEEMQSEIDKLAEQMSIMVTIMKDVRGEFLDVWRETGTSAGEAFVSSMKPYMDSLLGNISQVYYDVYFSNVTESLEDSFKKISEELVELKKQGANLNWDDVGGKLAGEFDKVLSAIISAKQESESFNEIIMQLQKQAIEAGLSLSELFELGLVSNTQGEVLETFKDAVLSDQDDGALTAIGDFMGDKIGKALSEKLMDNLFSSQILEFSNQLDSVLSGELKFSQLAGLMSQANAIGIGMEQSRLQLEAILAGFDFSADVNYTTDSSRVEYSSGTSQQNTYVYNISSAINASNVIESDSIQSLADELLDMLIEKLRVDKGVDITKNY